MPNGRFSPGMATVNPHTTLCSISSAGGEKCFSCRMSSDITGLVRTRVYPPCESVPSGTDLWPTQPSFQPTPARRKRPPSSVRCSSILAYRVPNVRETSATASPKSASSECSDNATRPNLTSSACCLTRMANAPSACLRCSSSSMLYSAKAISDEISSNRDTSSSPRPRPAGTETDNRP